MYNYYKFANKEYNLAHRTGINVGECLINLTFETLNGEQKSLSDFTNKPVILETGSLTCGMFAAQSLEMNKIAFKNTDFNIWNLVCSFEWQFAPASSLLFFYRNNLSSFKNDGQLNYFKSLNGLFQNSFTHTFSVRLSYFFDVNKVLK